ncbi:MAG TPA: PepSY domain-containing protein [Sphingomicrobium sp.]|nr:PepSY domain-containing protein [Sphingomicrobium sp.]
MKMTMVTAATALALAATPALAKAVQPHISMQDARSRALALVPGGRAQSGELETENGKLIYSFDIQAPKKTGIEEIQISALTGAVVSRKHETLSTEKSEARSEALEHRTH